MKSSKAVKKILENYSSESFGLISNLYRILNYGRLGGTGKLLILPVDQGFEHGPDRSFSSNIDSYDPFYHFKLAIDGKFSAYAAPLGFLESGIDFSYGFIPTILKINSGNSLSLNSLSPSQAITASVKDAVRLGCCAVGYTIYPGSNLFNDSVKNLKEIIREAREFSLPIVIWSYPRGEGVTKNGETAIDVISYAAHVAALLGAHIIKVKPPTSFIEKEESKKILSSKALEMEKLSNRISLVKRSCFNGKRLVVFSGGATKTDEDLLKEIKEINEGGGDGSIIGRNIFQRNREDAINLLDKIYPIYSR